MTAVHHVQQSIAIKPHTPQVKLVKPFHHHNRFTTLFPGPPGWAGARRELLDFVMQGKINRYTDHPAGRHSIRTNQCLPPLSPPFFTGRMPFLPPNQQCQRLKAMVNKTCWFKILVKSVKFGGNYEHPNFARYCSNTQVRCHRYTRFLRNPRVK